MTHKESKQVGDMFQILNLNWRWHIVRLVGYCKLIRVKYSLKFETSVRKFEMFQYLYYHIQIVTWRQLKSIFPQVNMKSVCNECTPIIGSVKVVSDIVFLAEGALKID
jgi:hypothetical protein